MRTWRRSICSTASSTDLSLGTTFTAGYFACRPAGMPHGPYRTKTGCTMIETRYRTS